MNWTLWWLFVPTEILLCMTPGPAVLLILSTALRLGGRRSIASNLGILAANTTYFVVSGTSLGALLLASYDLFFWIKWAGAAYLVFLGLKALLGRTSVVPTVKDSGKEYGASKLFLQALFLQLSNPKAIVFFAALLPQFVDPHLPVVRQLVILGVTSLVVEFAVLLTYGLGAGRALAIARQPVYATWTNRAAGILLLCAAAGIAMLKK